MYTIESTPLKEFIRDNGKYMLPRYQRQERWNPDRNFGLAISVFQLYPMGVIIVDERGGKSWLLDGRQRRNALEKIVNDPTTLYWWARKWIRFNNKYREDAVYKAFWKKVGSFIQKDDDEDNEEDKKNGVDDNVDDDAADEEVVIAENKKLEQSQRDRLEILLKLILMVHKLNFRKEEDREKWEDTFDFSDKSSGINPSYCTKKGINVPALRDFLIRYANSCDIEGKGLSKESFKAYCEENFNIERNDKLDYTINSKWEIIKYSITAVKESDDIFENVRIGTIRVTNMSFFDSLNIFSRVNSKGVPLKAEELLSANPFWNEPVERVAYDVQQDIKEMYKKLELTRLDNYVRWDIVATLIPRLKDKLVLKQDEDSGNFLGFKLLSSIYANGMSKRHLTDLEQKEEEIFGDDTKIDELVESLKTLLDILQRDEFFKHYLKGNRTLLELLGHAPALEFITILFRSWEKKGGRKYEKESEETMGLQLEARILFDRLVFEQLNNEWKGSGDARMARHIVDWENRLAEAPVPYSEWEEIITSACEGTMPSINAKRLIPVLYYSEVLRENGFCSSDNLREEPYEVDHIFPQKKLKNKYLNKEGNNKDCLANLELLPQSKNKSKGDARLNELDDDLKGVVARATGLRQKDIEETYSDPDIDRAFKSLVSDREMILLELFRTRRSELLGLKVDSVPLSHAEETGGEIGNLHAD